jgi:CubicO group peptidase (beta-lactamase class C family)
MPSDSNVSRAAVSPAALSAAAAAAAVGAAPVSPAALAAAETAIRAFHARGGQPGIAYGIVRDGELVQAGGLGERFAGGPVPDAGTVFRIASMTKSFTASVVLSLRDEGALALDDLAQTYVPELRGWPGSPADAERVSVRHLLTMTAGFPTDDPWGDRQQGLPLDEFGALLAGGVSFAWAPGTRFEYSNLGYAILGRIITAVTGTPYPDVVRARLLEPLGMTSTGYEASDFPDAALARGYRNGPDGWEEVPFDGCGAFAPMGGVFSCVRDLARWVTGFASAFPPAAAFSPAGSAGAFPPAAGSAADAGSAGAGGPLGHPLSPASRREMQLPRVSAGADRLVALPGGRAGRVASYGYGLFVAEDPVFGRIVSHSGGYPGFGSNMTWHPATGIGVIMLGNSTYAAMSPLVAKIMDLLLGEQPAADRPRYAVALAPSGTPWPQTLAAREAVNELLRSWDDQLADRLFTPNVAQDAPYAERRGVIDRIRDRVGDFHDDRAREPESDTPAHCRWWLTGDGGTFGVQIRLSPEREPRVQSLLLAVPPAAGSPLRSVLDEIVGWMNGGGRDWPDSLPAAADVDTGRLGRSLRAAAAWAGQCRLGACRSGDGIATAAVELVGEHATLQLNVSVDPSGPVLRGAAVLLLAA